MDFNREEDWAEVTWEELFVTHVEVLGTWLDNVAVDVEEPDEGLEEDSEEDQDEVVEALVEEDVAVRMQLEQEPERVPLRSL